MPREMDVAAWQEEFPPNRLVRLRYQSSQGRVPDNKTRYVVVGHFGTGAQLDSRFQRAHNINKIGIWVEEYDWPSYGLGQSSGPKFLFLSNIYTILPCSPGKFCMQTGLPPCACDPISGCLHVGPEVDDSFVAPTSDSNVCVRALTTALAPAAAGGSMLAV